MNITVHEPLGATIDDVPISKLDADTTDELRAALADHGVLVFPGRADLDDTAFVAFLRSFGDLAFTAGETPVDGHPDLNVVSNVGRTTPPRSSFHVDTSYVARPPAYTALRAVQIPEQGGETLFTNQYRAFETLEPGLRSELDGRSITHVMTGLELGDDAETSAAHPVFRPHPLTGRVALYLSTPARCRAIDGIAPDRVPDIVQSLLAHSTSPENTLRHQWSPGDVVMWDNGAVLHRADHSRVSGDRVMHRGMVAGYEP